MLWHQSGSPVGPPSGSPSHAYLFIEKLITYVPLARHVEPLPSQTAQSSAETQVFVTATPASTKWAPSLEVIISTRSQPGASGPVEALAGLARK